MPDSILIEAEKLLKEMREAASYPDPADSLWAHWFKFCQDNQERMLTVFYDLYEYAEELGEETP